MRKNVVAYDPGKITGVAYGYFSETEALDLTGVEAVPYRTMLTNVRSDIEYEVESIGPQWHHVTSEHFELRTNNNFAADLHAKKVEALLELYHGPGNIVWRERTTKSQVPDQILKDHGLWQTGTTVDWEDGRDVNDAIIHLLGFVAFDLRHVPTLRKYFR